MGVLVLCSADGAFFGGLALNELQPRHLAENMDAALQLEAFAVRAGAAHVEATRRQYEQKIAQKEAEVTKREAALTEQKAAIEKANESINEQVEAKVKSGKNKFEGMQP